MTEEREDGLDDGFGGMGVSEEVAEVRAELVDRRSESGPPRAPVSESQAVLDLHVCMGLNACKDGGVGKTGAMAGMGECATALHNCHGESACRGQGGCGYVGSDVEQAYPGQQACRNNGSCASPVNVSRVFAAGPYKGQSVWKQARKLFEARMYEAGLAFGPSPGEGYPDDKMPPYEYAKDDRDPWKKKGGPEKGVSITGGSEEGGT
jgi:hypothetical protein